MTTRTSQPPRPYPTPISRGPDAHITIQDYIRDKGITEIQIKQGDWKVPTLNLHLPHGWSDAGARTPAGAWGAIVPDWPNDPSDPPSVIATMSKLVGNVDIPMVLVYSSGDLYNLASYRPVIEPTLGSLDGYRAADASGTYLKDAKPHIVIQKTIVIPSNNGLYVLQLEAEGPEVDEQLLADTMEDVVDALTVSTR